MNVSVGSCCPELAQAHSSVALAWHQARGSTPFGVTIRQRATWLNCEMRSDVQCPGLGLVMTFLRALCASRFSRINACFAFNARCALDARSACVALVVFVRVGAAVASMCAYACVLFVVVTYAFFVTTCVALGVHMHPCGRGNSTTSDA